MANPEHLEILKKGVRAWNRWRSRPGLFLPYPDLSNSDLEGRDLTDVNLMLTNLPGANMSGVSLLRANLKGAHLQGANLRKAHLAVADLSFADLNNANLERAIFGTTILGETNLTNVTGLESCHHMSSSIIDHRTLEMSGKLPLSFLRGCGLPDTLIEYLPSLLNDPLQFYSCFISYSSKDQAFAERLYADLQNRGVRCWFAPEDIKIGDKFRTRIDESIRVYDKLLLVLSENSVSSQWVEKEVETAMEREGEQHKTMLFPVRLDDSVNEIKTGWPADIRRTRHIGDFTHWKEHDSYQKAFDRLLRDLKAEEK